MTATDESEWSDAENEIVATKIPKNNGGITDVNKPSENLTKINTERRPERISNKSKQRFKPLKPRILLVNHKEIPANVRMEIKTQNQYEILADNDDEVVITRPRPSPNSAKAKKIRVPPIIVPLSTGKAVTTAAIKTSGVAEFNIRNTSTGYYIFVNTVEDYKKIKESFGVAQIEHFSHDLPEDRISKVILKGLDRIEPETLKEHLAALDLEPADVKIITPKKSTHSNNVIYLLYYKQGSVDMKKLYGTKAINHTIVRWEPYRNNRTSLTQCRRCQRFGHGTRNCQMSPRCQLCAGNHSSEYCPLLKAEYEKIKKNDTAMDEDGNPPETEIIRNITPKCVNCNGAHLASDNSCSEREKYRELQTTLARKTAKKPTKNNTLRYADFPSLTVPSHGLVHHQATPRTHQTMFYSQVVNSSPPPPGTSNDAHQGNGCSNDLFSFQEINSLLKEILHGLRGCRNKADQFEVISSLAIKFVYNHNGSFK